MSRLFDTGQLTVDVENEAAVQWSEPVASAHRPFAWPMRIVIAALALGNAAIHFAMVPSHAAESTAQAVGFGIASWLSLGLGIAVLVRADRRVLATAAVVHAAYIAIWLWSRTAGLPFGIHDGHPESFTGIDVLANAMAVGIVVCSVVAMWRPAMGRRSGALGMALSGVVAGGVMLASSVALASPSARDHAQHSHADATVAATAGSPAGETVGHSHDDAAATDGSGTAGGGDAATGTNVADQTVATPTTVAGHSHGSAAAPVVEPSALAGRCDLGFNPVSFWQETQAVHGGEATAYEGSPQLDELIRKTTASGAELKDAELVVALAHSDPATYDGWVNWLPNFTAAAHTTATGAPDDNAGHGGHIGPQAWIPMTDQAECDQLASELDRVRAITAKYPHPGDAEAAGWHQVTGYVPGIAAHYMNFGYVDGTFDIDKPEMLLYDGTGPTANVVGVSYYLVHDSDFEPSQGFTGPNDHFHRHIGLCVGGGGVIGDSNTTEEECAARGGVKQQATGGWMNHVWIVPGCESPWGMFSGASPIIDDGLGGVSGSDGGGCAGSSTRGWFDLTSGTADNVPPSLIGSSAA